MGFVTVVTFATLMILTKAQESNVTKSIVSQTQSVIQNDTTILNNSTKTVGRRGRQLQIDRIELPFSGTEVKKQIIKIPPNVSKVKVIGSGPVARPRKLVSRRRTTPTYYSQEEKRNLKSQYDVDEYDSNQMYLDTSVSGYSNDLRRSYKRQRGHESAYDEFYEDEGNLGLGHYLSNEPETIKYKKYRASKWPVKAKRKIPNENFGGVKFVQTREQDSSVKKNRYRGSGREEAGYYDYEPIDPPRYINQYEMPSVYGQKTPYLSNGSKQQDKQIYTKFYETENHVAPLTIKRVPVKGRKSLGIQNTQYTTHNPQVATNFGLSEFNSQHYYPFPQKMSYAESSAPSGFSSGGGSMDKYNNPIVAASEHSVSSFPVLTPGIKVIQAPQFAEVTVSHPSNPSRLMSSPTQQQEQNGSQKATIRDILEQDCPNYDSIGFCESPPRYPMHQINIIVKKCASLVEAMTSQNVNYPQDHNAAFSERSDLDIDNNTLLVNEFNNDKHVVQKRGTGEGIPACRSDFSVIEPGYAKDESTGRWFVIVQHPEVTQQRLTTDTCKNPGKPCAGLTEMKCIRAYSNGQGNKTTKCVQKYAYHKLISWDPDAPDTCPRMRTFKFPSACVCHVGVA